MELNLDTSFFSVVCELDGALYTPERDVAEMRLSRIIEDLRTGQFENVHAILEFNPAEGWCNDVTNDVMGVAFPDREFGYPGEWQAVGSDFRSERVSGRIAGVTERVAA